MATARTQETVTQDAAVTVIGGSVGPAEAKKHFEAFETHFFQQGDEANFGAGPDGYQDGYYEGGKERRRLLSYRSMAGLTVISTSLAIAACVALLRSNAPAPASAPAMAKVKHTAVAPGPAAPPLTTPPAAAAATAAGLAAATPVPAGAPLAPAAAAEPSGRAQDPSPTAVAAAPGTPTGIGDKAKIAETKPTELKTAEAKPAEAKTAEAKPAEGKVAEAKPAEAKPAEGKAAEAKPAEAKTAPTKVAEAQPSAGTKAGAKPTKPGETVAAAAPAATSGESGARERCRQSVRDKHAKDIVAQCTAAFAADETDAEAAVAVARVEFDRGRFAQAYTWSKKAIAVNPDAADAYVFAGAAEQNQGHAKAAKEAYQQYLRLAPSGRYASDVRSIVGSL